MYQQERQLQKTDNKDQESNIILTWLDILETEFAVGCRDSFAVQG